LDVANFHTRFSETYFSVREVASKRRSSKAGKIITTRKLRTRPAKTTAQQPAAT
jgi:hypothetical protein